MKTETLIELQRSITQGEWTVSKKIPCFVEVAKDGQGMTMIADCSDCDDDRPRSEDQTNARAIALVPELIAEVIRLREVLRACVTQLDAETLGGEALDSARAALANDK